MTKHNVQPLRVCDGAGVNAENYDGTALMRSHCVVVAIAIVSLSNMAYKHWVGILTCRTI